MFDKIQKAFAEASDNSQATVEQFFIDSIRGNTENGALLSERFIEDKYFARQIDRFADLKEGSYITVGKIIIGSPIERVGIPAGNLYFDVSKIR